MVIHLLPVVYSKGEVNEVMQIEINERPLSKCFCTITILFCYAVDHRKVCLLYANTYFYSLRGIKLRGDVEYVISIANFKIPHMPKRHN